MSQMSPAMMDTLQMASHSDTPRVLRRTIIIGLTAFLTVVDLFATQAILPSLAQAYRVSPAAMSFCGQREHDGDGSCGPLCCVL
jgi:MFS transporter, YNFM family, putative membrane transport protein